MRVLWAVLAASLAGVKAIGDPALSWGGRRPAAFTVRQWRRAQHRSEPLLVVQGERHGVVAASYPERNFTQKLDHLGHDEGTFRQRFWYDATFYEPGGPIIVLDGGETSGAGRLPFLETGILKILAKEVGGLGVVLEHRFYGKSMPLDDLSTDSLRYLTTAQHLADCAYFARHLELPDADISNSPWIIYGGSYAGAAAAFARKVYPDVFWGGIASSAVTHAQVDYWQYFETIRTHAPAKCMANLETFTAFIDATLSLGKPKMTSALKWAFGMPNVTDDRDFVNVLSSPLGFWQARNWDPKVSTAEFDRYCDALEGSTDDASLVLDLVWLAFISYARYTREEVEGACESHEQDECFGTGDATFYRADDLSQTWRSWIWQVCTEWGYFQGGAPEGQPTIVSRLITVEYNARICDFAFGKAAPSTPNVTMVNRYGDFGLSSSRLAFIDGSADPWIGATPHSPWAADGGERNSTASRPFWLIPQGVHHWDEGGAAQEPPEIVAVHAEEKRFVKAWVDAYV